MKYLTDNNMFVVNRTKRVEEMRTQEVLLADKAGGWTVKRTDRRYIIIMWNVHICLFALYI